jgi:transcriptional regulator with XRE-family HTH domain
MHISCNPLQDYELAHTSSAKGRYTRRVSKKKSAPARPMWAERISELIGSEHGRLASVARAAGMDSPQLDRLRRGENDNPTVQVLERIAKALKVPVGELFTRPEGEAGRVNERSPREGAGIFEELLATLDTDAPAEDTTRGDILKAQSALASAQAALNRALRRADEDGRALPGDRSVAGTRR